MTDAQRIAHLSANCAAVLYKPGQSETIGDYVIRPDDGRWIAQDIHGQVCSEGSYSHVSGWAREATAIHAQKRGAMIRMAEDLAVAVEIAARGGRIHENDRDMLLHMAKGVKRTIAEYEGRAE